MINEFDVEGIDIRHIALFERIKIFFIVRAGDAAGFKHGSEPDVDFIYVPVPSAEDLDVMHLAEIPPRGIQITNHARFANARIQRFVFGQSALSKSQFLEIFAMWFRREPEFLGKLFLFAFVSSPKARKPNPNPWRRELESGHQIHPERAARTPEADTFAVS